MKGTEVIMKETIVAASRNQHKIDEMQAILKKFSMEIISRDDAGVPKIEIEEDGETFEENSCKKAYEIMKLCGKTTISDDSGLMVDYLGGAPGVYSARFAGEDGNDEKNNEKLLTLLADVPYKERRAKFVSVITMVFPSGESITARGECHGHIIDTPVGEMVSAMILCLYRMVSREHLRSFLQKKRMKSAIEQMLWLNWKDC